MTRVRGGSTAPSRQTDVFAIAETSSCCLLAEFRYDPRNSCSLRATDHSHTEPCACSQHRGSEETRVVGAVTVSARGAIKATGTADTSPSANSTPLHCRWNHQPSRGCRLLTESLILCSMTGSLKQKGLIACSIFELVCVRLDTPIGKERSANLVSLYKVPNHDSSIAHGSTYARVDQLLWFVIRSCNGQVAGLIRRALHTDQILIRLACPLVEQGQSLV